VIGSDRSETDFEEVNNEVRVLFEMSFLKPDSKNLFTVFPEISAIAFDDDRKILSIGTS